MGYLPQPVKKVEEEIKVQTDFIEYDLDYGKLSYRDKEVTVRSSKMMPDLLKELFSSPKKSRDCHDILENIGLDDMTSDRSVGDCIRQINTKIKKLGIREDVFSYRADKVLTTEGFLKNLRIKVSHVESK